MRSRYASARSTFWKSRPRSIMVWVMSTGSTELQETRMTSTPAFSKSFSFVM